MPKHHDNNFCIYIPLKKTFFNKLFIDSTLFSKTPKRHDNNFLYLHTYFKKIFFKESFIDSAPSKSPTEGIKYFFHFRKNFINPYGPAHDASPFTDQQIGARLSQMNCEFLTRPNIAISEFSHTFLANMEYLEQNISILDEKGMMKYLHKMNNYKDALRVLN